MMTYDGILFKPPIDDIFIEHHGVKGMKWGVRHDPVRSGRNRSMGVKKKKRRTFSEYVFDSNVKYFEKKGVSNKEARKATKKRLSTYRSLLPLQIINSATVVGTILNEHRIPDRTYLRIMLASTALSLGEMAYMAGTDRALLNEARANDAARKKKAG